MYPTKHYADLIIPNGTSNPSGMLVIVEHIRLKIEQVKGQQNDLAKLQAAIKDVDAEDDPLKRIAARKDSTASEREKKLALFD